MRIGAISSYERFVGAIFNDFALLDDDDAIGHAHRGKTMGNEQGCGARGDLLKLAEDFRLGFSIYRRCRLIQDNDGRTI